MRHPFRRFLHWADRVVLRLVMGSAARILERAVTKSAKGAPVSPTPSAHIEHQPQR